VPDGKARLSKSSQTHGWENKSGKVNVDENPKMAAKIWSDVYPNADSF